MRVAGLLLAAGAGRRAGGPKALRRFEDGEAWVARAARVLRDGGCDRVLVVIGAEAGAVVALVPPWAEVVVCDGWAEGMGASLKAGLAALADPPEQADPQPFHDPDDTPLDAPGDGSADGVSSGSPETVAAVIGLVDTTDVTAEVVARVLDRGAPVGPASLARAVYQGRPGHPVLIGRDHWPGVRAGATGDRGARDYLATRAVRPIECGDLATGSDRDTT